MEKNKEPQLKLNLLMKSVISVSDLSNANRAKPNVIDISSRLRDDHSREIEANLERHGLLRKKM